MEPEESLQRDGLCPECGKPLVLGVLHRVVQLADRPKGGKPATAMPCEYIIPLAELLAEIFDCGASTKKVQRAFDRLLARHGPEFAILRQLDVDSLDQEEPALLGEAVRRLRSGQVIRKPGYDGEYGVIRVFADGEKDTLRQQGVFLEVPADNKQAASGGRRKKATRKASTVPASGVRETRESFKAGQGAARVRDKTLGELTEEQHRAATTTDGSVIIVAGPGTGKTRTLTHRMAYLVAERNVDPRSILAVTFTNRAAGEMRHRLHDLLGDACEGMTVSTFHSFCLQVLREHAVEAGLAEDFRLADREEQVRLLASVAGMTSAEAADTVDRVADARRDLQDPSSVNGYAALDRACKEARLLGLDELIPFCVKWLGQAPDILAGIRPEWLCIDEYQDINRCQYELVRLLAPDGRGLCVIGDPDQAIYGFRGSDVGFFLKFTQDFPGARVFPLSCNFRSTQNIVRASGQVIGPEQTSMSVGLGSSEASGLQIRFHEAATAAAEAEFITHEIETWLGGTALFSMDSARVSGHAESLEVSFGDIAVLVRLRALISPLKTALERLGLPVQAVGDQPFLALPGARQVLDLMRRASAQGASQGAESVMTGIASDPAAMESIDEDGRTAFEECTKLAAVFPGSIGAFLDHLALRQGADRYEAGAERVTVMTLHAAKGLEFPVVFVAACEDGIIPFARAGQCEDPAEERRLLYVGMTRAERALYITSARRRSLFGQTGERHLSPFAREIEQALREDLRSDYRKRPHPAFQEEFDFRTGVEPRQ